MKTLKTDNPYKDIVEREGNDANFKHAGFQCYLLRHPDLGHWCGYVVVSGESPLFGLDYDNDILAGVEVHGGLTWARAPHFPAPANSWSFGFDCAHAWDIEPFYDRIFSSDATYKTKEFVEQETRSLAEQLRNIVLEGQSND